jgi:hypothetical protein
MKSRRIPNFAYEAHPDITLTDLARMENPKPLCEGFAQDTDGDHFFYYTVVGELDGQEVAIADHVRKQAYGALVGGDLMIIHTRHKGEADAMAEDGLRHTVELLRAEQIARGTVEIGPNAGTIAAVEERSVRH